jgi:hypothetical protein
MAGKGNTLYSAFHNILYYDTVYHQSSAGIYSLT